MKDDTVIERFGHRYSMVAGSSSKAKKTQKASNHQIQNPTVQLRRLCPVCDSEMVLHMRVPKKVMIWHCKKSNCPVHNQPPIHVIKGECSMRI